MTLRAAFVAILLLAASVVRVCGVVNGATTNLTGIAEKFSSCLVQKFYDAAVNFSAIQALYAERYADQEMMEERLDGMEAVLDLAVQLAQDFQEIADALRNTTVVIEQEYLAHIGKNCCSSQCIGINYNRNNCYWFCPEVQASGDSSRLEFYRSQVDKQKLNDDAIFMDLTFEHDAVTGWSVNLTETALHYPVDTYDRDPHLLCFAQWSKALTSRYIQLLMDITLSAGIVIENQYFSSSNGSLRFYPAYDWAYLDQCHRCPLTRVDSYDSYFRPWYVNTIPGAKFLVIVMDMSGSVTGFRLLLAKLTAKELLLSLSQNDFFLVLAVGGEMEESKSLGECFTTKTRASPENVITMIEVIEAISNTATYGPIKSYTGVVNRTLKVFGKGQECHMIFAFLSDRGALVSDLAASLENGGVVDMQVRVFVILTGFVRKILYEDRDRLEGVACRSGGRFQEIQKYSDIKAFMKIFNEHLRSLIPDNAGKEVFWNMYKGLFGNLVLTCSQPLYTTKEKDETSRTFVGVGGIDVNLKLLESSFYKYDLGLYGYGFIVDNNGQLLVHPLINQSYIEMVSGDDLISLDIGRYEHAQNSSDFEVLRRLLLDRKNGSRTMEAWVPVRGQNSGFRLMNMTYYYAPIQGTQFSMAIVIPESSVTTVNTRLTSKQIQALSNLSLTLYSIDQKRPICNQAADLPPSSKALEFLKKLVMKLTDDSNSSVDNCNSRLYNNLLFDLRTSLLLTNKTIELYRRNFQPRYRNYTQVLYFSSGLTTCSSFPPSRNPNLEAQRQSCDVFLSSSSLRDAILHQASSQNIRNNLFFHEVNGHVAAARFLEWNESSDNMEPNLGSLPYAILVQIGATASCSSFTSCLMKASAEEKEEKEENSSIKFLLGQGRGLVLCPNDEDQEAIGTFADLHPQVFNDFFASEMSSTTIKGFELRPCFDIFQNTTECTGSDAYSDYKGVVLSLLSGVWWVLSGGPLLTLQCALISLHTCIAALLAVAEEEPSADSTRLLMCPVNLCERQVNSFHWPVPPIMAHGAVSCNATEEIVLYELASVPRTNLLLLQLHQQDSSCSNASLLDLPELVPVRCPCNACAYNDWVKMMNGESDTCTPEDIKRGVYRTSLMDAGSRISEECYSSNNITRERCPGNGALSISMDTSIINALCLMAAVYMYYHLQHLHI